MLTLLDPNFNQFPPVHYADDSGLLAIGGNLLPKTLIKAYQNGIFPWYSEGDPICWYAPPERCVIFPELIKISKSMKQVLRSEQFTFTKNVVFEQVIQHCANISRVDQDGTWIVNEIQEAYMRLHEMGHASSVEVWMNGALVGGLYGVEQGKVFCGESMFSLVSNASKSALIHLCTAFEYTLIDCQIHNPHLESMGAEIISRDRFLSLIKAQGLQG